MKVENTSRPREAGSRIRGELRKKGSHSFWDLQFGRDERILMSETTPAWLQLGKEVRMSGPKESFEVSTLPAPVDANQSPKKQYQGVQLRSRPDPRFEIKGGGGGGRPGGGGGGPGGGGPGGGGGSGGPRPGPGPGPGPGPRQGEGGPKKPDVVRDKPKPKP